MSYSLKQKLGVLFFDWPRFEKGLRCPAGADGFHSPWVEICNRKESLERAPQGPGVLCRWKWASDLHAAKVYPSLGRRLMKRATQDWPIAFRNEPLSQREDVRLSFVIGHRGIDRLPHLIATIKTIAAQIDVSAECIVIEQSYLREIEQALPSWVRYFHTPPPSLDTPYCRSWAFNVGARKALGTVLIFHDSDLPIPARYAEEVMKRHGEGHEVINLKRFIFYLDEAHTLKTMALSRLPYDVAPFSIMQNLEAGGSLAVDRDAFFAIGGFDEAFVGWGGEDNEFWERAQTRKVWPYGYLPLIHFWHAAQPGKLSVDKTFGKELYWKLSLVPPEMRIKNLVNRPFGRTEGPTSGYY